MYHCHEILSHTLVKLKDKNKGKLFKNPVHLDRLKITFVRAPNPTNYCIQESVVANETEHDVNDQQSNIEKRKQPVTKNTENTSNDDIQDLHLPTRSRPKRQIRKPVRYLSNSEYGHQTSDDSSSTDSKLNVFWPSELEMATKNTQYNIRVSRHKMHCGHHLNN